MSTQLKCAAAASPPGWWAWPAQVWRRTMPQMRVGRRVRGLKVYMCLRDNIRQLVSVERTCHEIDSVLREDFASMWDLGCNIGLYSIIAAAAGKRVAAFDISHKAIALLSASAAANCLEIEAVPRAVTVEGLDYAPVVGAHTENRLTVAEGAQVERSLGFEQAAADYGVPDLIKMDIEGGERDFLAAPEFKRWVVENGIILMIELHSHEAELAVWSDRPLRWIDSKHVVINTTVGGYSG